MFFIKKKTSKMSKSFLECLLLIIHLSLSSECLKRDRSQTTPRSLPAPAPAAAPGAETPADKGRSLEPEPRRQIRGQGLIFCNVDVNPSCNTKMSMVQWPSSLQFFAIFFNHFWTFLTPNNLLGCPILPTISQNN